MELTTDIGSRLQRAREQRGMTLQEIAASTKIPTRSLGALERGDFDCLPGGVFRRAYLRTFAAAVGLDGDELVRDYRARFEIASSDGPLQERGPSWRDRVRVPLRLPTTMIVTIGMLIGGLLISRQGAIHLETPEKLGGGAVEAGGADGANAEEGGAFANAVIDRIPAPALRLEIRTTGFCWVSATADGERAVYRLMRAGDRALVDARGTITLRVGDAGAVAYSINGTTGRALGRDGQAVTVHIDRDTVNILAPEPDRAMPATQTRSPIAPAVAARG